MCELMCFIIQRAAGSSRLLLLGHAHSAPTTAGGLGVLTAHTQTVEREEKKFSPASICRTHGGDCRSEATVAEVVTTKTDSLTNQNTPGNRTHNPLAATSCSVLVQYRRQRTSHSWL